MKVLRALGCALAGWAMVAGSVRATDPAIDLCRVPEALIEPTSSLPAVAESIAAKKPIKVVVVGTASSLGTGVSTPEKAYPRLLQGELENRLHPVALTIVNLSQRGWTAAEMAASFEARVIPLQPTLVIWQTGTVEAVRGIDANEMGDALVVGIQKLQARKIDVILIEPQYSPHTTALINFMPYADYMGWIARSLDVNLFNRFEIMKHWVEERFVTFDEPGRALQRLGADQVHNCIAVLLADMIARATHLEAPGSEIHSAR
jgi:lysophospholipase L1-like esterase